MGTKFMSGYAVAAEEAEGLARRLDALMAKGEIVKKAFMASLESNIKAWHELKPEWKRILMAGTPAIEKIERKIMFGYIPTVVGAPENPSIAGNFLTAVGAMSNNLVEEITKDARLFVRQSLKDGRSQGSQKTVDPIRRLVRKIEALQFIEPALGSLAPVLKAVLSTIPEEGQVKADLWLNLCRVATLLSDKDRLNATSHALHSGATSIEEVLKSLMGENAVIMSVAANQVTAAAVPLEVADQPLTAAQLFTQDPDDQTEIRTAEVNNAVREITGRTKPVSAKVTAVAAPVYDSVDF